MLHWKCKSSLQRANSYSRLDTILNFTQPRASPVLPQVSQVTVPAIKDHTPRATKTPLHGSQQKSPALECSLLRCHDLLSPAQNTATSDALSAINSSTGVHHAKCHCICICRPDACIKLFYLFNHGLLISRYARHHTAKLEEGKTVMQSVLH